MKEAPLVLLVDDQADNLYMYTHHMEGKGRLRLITAMTGTEALLKARRFRPDVVVVDVSMPEMDGFEVAAALAADPATKDMPVILLSAYPSAAEAIKRRKPRMASFVDQVAEGYLSKPCLPNVLLEHVQRVLAERRSARAVPA